jgi:O-antigen ligase
MQDPNSLGGYLAVTTLAAPIVMRDATLSRARRLVYLALYGLGLLVTVLSLSRAAWVGVVLGHAVALFFLSPRLLFATAVATALALPAAYPFMPELIRERVEETFRTRSTVYIGAERFGSGADRIVYYRIGATMLAESPIWGHGMDSFMMMTPKYGAQYGMLANRASHSVLVKLAAESGLLGLAMLGWLALTIGLLGWRLARGGGPDTTLGIALLAGTASISAANLFQVSFIADHAIAGTLWILFGACARARVDARRLSRRAAAPVGWRARLLEASAAQPAGLAARNASTSR